MNYLIALFAESEKGRFHYPYFCDNLIQLAEIFGNPPEESLGLHFAIQAIMYERQIIFFRVQEEGFSIKDYMKGIEILKDKNKIKHLNAICLPKVGNHIIIDSLDPVIKLHRSIIITTEKDLFDYLLSA
jgi:hypothetical protein